jgi:nucleotide-binding universal stress UspA family protein
MQILCPTDFSQPAHVAADLAAVLAAKFQLPLRLLHCGQLWISEVPIHPMETLVLEQLAKEASRLRDTGVEVIEEFRRGNPSIEIIAAASELATKLIVLGAEGHGTAERWLLGSVAERVAEGAAVPTLVVRDSESLQSWLTSSTPLKLCCGLDGSTSADIALVGSQAFQALGATELNVVSIRAEEYPPPTAQQKEQRQADLSERVRTLMGRVPEGVQIHHSLEHPAVEFLRAAESLSTDLIVVGTHQRHGLRRLLAPSFSRGVLAHARTNVLCVPAISGDAGWHVPQIRRVLLATNFTPVCTEALRHAHSLLPHGGEIRFVHVCHEPKQGLNPIVATSVFLGSSLASAAEQRAAAEKIESLPQALLEVSGVTISSEILSHHDVAGAILDAAERSAADVICLGSKGHSRLGAALLGSTANAVIARAHKPVFVVTPPVA